MSAVFKYIVVTGQIRMWISILDCQDAMNNWNTRHELIIWLRMRVGKGKQKGRKGVTRGKCHNRINTTLSSLFFLTSSAPPETIIRIHRRDIWALASSTSHLCRTPPANQKSVKIVEDGCTTPTYIREDYHPIMYPAVAPQKVVVGSCSILWRNLASGWRNIYRCSRQSGKIAKFS